MRDVRPDTERTHLYRARVFQSDGKLEGAMIRPDRELGAPPSHFASAGRMNAKGISVFYGATSVDTALAEVRPPVGSQVAIAQFELLRPIRLLDLTALEEIHESGSIFDPEYAYRLGRMMFLRKLTTRIARPVMPDDQDAEYLATQAVADFLATEGRVPLDGILYPSVQVDGAGLNIVLFHKAARCRELEFPDGTEFSARTFGMYEDGPEPEYWVTEDIPSNEEASKSKESDDPFDFLSPQLSDIGNHDFGDYDDREETLGVDLQSLRVHVISAVQFRSSEYQVTRHRWGKSEASF
nr:RES family NAD+ phosphorylase [Parvibaculum lavamentivorans]